MAIKANFTIDQGTDFVASIDVIQDDGVSVFDLTGYSVAAQMRKNYASTSAVTFISTHTAEGGQIILSLPSSTTVDIEPGRYLYDVEITSDQGAITRVVEGVATVTPGITRI